MNQRTRGFTLVEIMIVILIIGLLLTVAAPQWVKARESAREKTCLANLQRISSAKEQCAMQNRLGNGQPVTEDDLVSDFLKGTGLPVCPAGGNYGIEVIGAEPTCSLHAP